MKRLRACGMATACVLAFAPSDLAEAQEPDLEKRIHRLCVDLQSDDIEIRTRATQDLIRIGAPVLPALKKLLGDANAESRERVGVIQEAIRKHALRQRLKLSIATDKPSYPLGTYLGNIRTTLTLTNTAQESVVLVQKAIHMPGCVGYPKNLFSPILNGAALIQAEPPRFSCFGDHFHPLEKDHFLVVDPGETKSLREQDTILLMISVLVDAGDKGYEKARDFFSDAKAHSFKPGKYRLKLRYSFKKTELEKRYFPTDSIRMLWDQVLEVELESTEAEFEIRDSGK